MNHLELLFCLLALLAGAAACCCCPCSCCCREQEIIRLLLEGAAGKEIGTRLFISMKSRVQLYRLNLANALD